MSNERVVRNAVRPAKRHVSVETTYARERIVCSCGDIIAAQPDKDTRDRHGPLIEAWQAHCRAFGVANDHRRLVAPATNAG